MPEKRFTAEQLYRVRNSIPINALIKQLQIQYKVADGVFRFLCPCATRAIRQPIRKPILPDASIVKQTSIPSSLRCAVERPALSTA